MGTLIAMLLSALLALFALIRGPQRVLAAIALILAAAFVLLFSGLAFALFS